MVGGNEKDNLTQALTIVKDFVEDISGDKLQELLQMPPYVHAHSAAISPIPGPAQK